MAFGAFYLRDPAGSPERARWLHLARSGNQSQRAIWFILPARGASRIITIVMYQSNRSFNIPPGQPLGHLNFGKIFVQIPPSPGRKAVEMPPPQGKLQD